MRGIHYQYSSSFTFQWHLTTKCNYNCKHCYIYEKETYQFEKNAADRDTVFKILAAIDKFFNQLENHFKKPFKKNIILTGGDPLLSPFILKLIREITKKNYNIGILGCPETFTLDNIDFLKKMNLKSIQFSIDGLENSHDKFRNKKGSFELTIKKTKELQSIFNVNIMTTVCEQNIDEVIPLIDYLDKQGVKNFDFARVAFLGNAGSMNPIKPEKYRNFLNQIFVKEEELKINGSTLHIGKKDNLWKLLFYEKGLLEIDKRKILISGCPCGYTSLSILTDGTIFICRRFNSKIGKLPEDDLFDIYMNHRKIKNFRNISQYEGCSICRLKYICRGCPAIGNSLHKQISRRDPQCWRIVMP